MTISVLGGCGGSSSSQSPPPPPPPPPAPDTTAPTVGDVETPSGSSFNRTVTLSVTANDNVAVTEVRFFSDGNLIGTDTSTPYTVEWDTSAESDSDHVLSAEAEDAEGNVGQSGEVIVTVANIIELSASLAGVEEVPAVDTAGSGEATFTVNLASGAIEGELTTDGITATDAHIHDGFAGSNGPVLIGLEQDGNDASLFRVPANATLDASAVDDLLAAGLYVNAHTAAHPGGEVRAQILPKDFLLRFAVLSGDNEVPRVDSIARGRAAITLNLLTGAIVVQARVEGLPDASNAHVHDGFAGDNGPVLVGLAQDPMDGGRWFVEDGELNAAALDAFAAGGLYVNVHSPANPGGEIRGQILPEGITVLVTELTGEQEVPAVETEASAVGFLTHDVDGELLTIHVNTLNLADASDAHLHGAYAGVNGGVRVGLTQDGSEPAHWFAELQAMTPDLADALAAGATYLNVHTPANPGGEIRGQVIPEGILFAFGRLEGSQEVPAIDSDAGGTFAVTVDPSTSVLQAHANTSGADDAENAHLHDGYAGVSGPVSIGLTQDPNEVSHWSASDVVLTANQLTAFTSGRFYVNVHTPANPGGEIRGQAAPPPIDVLFTTLSGEQEVPAVASDASGVAAVTTDREAGTVTLHLRADGADDAVMAHIHGAFAGSNGGVLIGLSQDAQDVMHWSVVEAQFDETGLDDYLAGRTYVNLHTPANPGGEIRGQIVPRDIAVLFSAMDGDQVVPPVTTVATGLAASTLNKGTRRMVVFVNASGVDDATSAGVHRGAAGANGPEVLPLEQTPMMPGQWSGEVEPLDAASYGDYLAGNLYAQVATPAEVDGEIRGQIVTSEPGAVDTEAPAVEVTVPADSTDVSGTISVEATATDNLAVSVVRFLADGVLIDSDASAPYSVQWDTTGQSNGDVTLTAEAEDAAGNVGTSSDVVVTVANAAAVTLAQIQADVFTPTCSVPGCHTGPSSNLLPSGMNLSSASDSAAALINVQSLQEPELNRVTPGDPDNSYLIRKLEGTNTIGTRMPQGGTPLSQATIDMIRDWIANEAQDTGDRPGPGY